MLLVDACVHVRRVLRAVLAWLLVVVSSKGTASRCELVAVVVITEVVGIGIGVVLVWARQVAQRAMLGCITCLAGVETGLIER